MVKYDREERLSHVLSKTRRDKKPPGSIWIARATLDGRNNLELLLQ